MPKSAKKAASKVDSTPAVVEQPTEATKNGKRDAEEDIEKNVASSKKQKIVNGDVSPAVETKKVRTKTKKIKTKKQESNSSELEEKDKKEEPKEPDAVVKNDVASLKNDDLDNESESNGRKSSDEEDAKAASEAKAPVEPTAKVEEESHDDKENPDEEPAEPQAVKEDAGVEMVDASSAEKTDAGMEMVDASSAEKADAGVEMVDASSAEKADAGVEMVDASSAKKADAGVEMVDALSAKKAPQTPAISQATESKTLFMGNLSFSIEISDVINFFKDAGEIVEVRFTIRDGCFAGYGHVEFATHNAAKKALKLDGEFLLDRDVRLDFAKEKSAYTPNNGNESSSQKSGQSLTDADVEMVDASSAKKAPQTSATPHATESKTLFLGNLSFSIKESDVVNFFKDAGEVVAVRLAMKDDRLAGYGHVDFATHDAAQKAFKLNGESLLDRNVRIDFAKGRPTHTPSNGNERSSQKSGESQGLTVFVKGFGIDDGFDSVRSTLEEHFGQCGEITRMAIPKDFRSGGPKGVAFIEFTNSEAFNKALELNGSEVSGGPITVEEAKQSSRNSDGDGGKRGGRGKSGGRDGGRGRGRGSGRGRGKGR